MERSEKQEPVAYKFIKTVECGTEGWKAIVADANKVDVEALRSASRAGQFNQIRMRDGVHFMTLDQVDAAHTAAVTYGKQENANELRRAHDVLEAKMNGLPIPVARPAALTA